MRRHINFLSCYIGHSIFALENAGLITDGGIYTCLGVILIHYAQYMHVLALRVRYVRYTLACYARCLSWYEFARHFESHLARPPSFYMRMQTRQLPMNIPLLLCYIHSTRIIFSTYSFKYSHSCPKGTWNRISH